MRRILSGLERAPRCVSAGLTQTITFAGALIAASLFCGSPATAGPDASIGAKGDCAADGLRSVCGVSKPEDMVPLVGSAWVIVSGYKPDAIYRVDRRSHQAVNLAASIRIQWNKRDHPGCPGPLVRGGLTAHGIAVVDGKSPALLVINHGSREAVEIYKVRRRDAALTWVGCVPVPGDMMANSIAPLASGGFAATSLGKPGTNVLLDIVAGRPTGEVRLWSRREGWKTLPNSQGSGPNGLAVARDGRSIYVNMSGSRQIVRMYLDGRPAMRSAQIDILPDNLRWGTNGKLTTTGMRFDPGSNMSCLSRPGCHPPFDVYEVDPGTLTATSLSWRFKATPMPLATTALRLGDELWVSSIGGERIVIFPLMPM